MTTKIQKFSFVSILLILVLKNQFSERPESCGERMEDCWREMGGMWEKNNCVRDSNVGFPRGSVIKNLPANAGYTGDSGLIPGLGRSAGGGHGNPLQYSRLENPRDGGAWWAAVYGFAQSRTRLKQLSSSSSSVLLRGGSL